MGNLGQTRLLLSQIVPGRLGHSDSPRCIAERNRTLKDCSHCLCDFDRIVRLVEGTSESAAVLFPDEPFTHTESSSEANPLARHLRPPGVNRETLDGLCLECPQDAIAQLAMMKADVLRSTTRFAADLKRFAHPAAPQAALENGEGVHGNLG